MTRLNVGLLSGLKIAAYCQLVTQQVTFFMLFPGGYPHKRESVTRFPYRVQESGRVGMLPAIIPEHVGCLPRRPRSIPIWDTGLVSHIYQAKKGIYL